MLSCPQHNPEGANTLSPHHVASRDLDKGIVKASLSQHSLQTQTSANTPKALCADLIFGHNTELSHDQTFLCIGSYHGNSALHCCVECENSAYQQLTCEQEEIVTNPPRFPLCHDCGLGQLFNDAIPVCLCLVAGTKCTQCLYETLEKLIVARAKMASKCVAECFSCYAKLSGDEEVSRCKFCYGITAPLSPL